ncbi:MAG: A24 family peptidase [Ktedonobacterales bacterium]
MTLFAQALPPWLLYALLYLVTALVGLGVGSVVNLLADRVIGEDEPKRSACQCARCGELLPHPRLITLPALWRRGHCPNCNAPLSLRRPLVEATLALLTPLLLAHLLASNMAPHLPLWAVFAFEALTVAVLAGVFVVDLEHRLIYDIAIYPLGALALLLALVFDRRALLPMVFGVVIGGGLFLIFYGLGWLIYQQEALGFGDVKLAALAGLLVGWPAITTTLLLTAVSGAVVSLLLLVFGGVERRSFIPFGIFLAAAAALTLLVASPVW